MNYPKYNAEELLEKFNNAPLLVKYQNLGAAYMWKEFDGEANEARKHFEDSKYYNVEANYKITDHIWIIVIKRPNSEEIMYAPVVDNKPIHEMFDTIERAIVGAVSYYLTGRTEAGYWAMKLIESQSVKERLLNEWND